ncbi:hypothetical protein ACVCL0_13510 [Rhodanobacter sp. UC4450_H17]
MQLVPEAVERVRRGHAIETERLKGSRFIVAVMVSAFSIDSFLDDVYLCDGFEDMGAAVDGGRIEHRKHVAAGFAAHADDRPPWRQLEATLVDCLSMSPKSASGMFTVAREKIGDDGYLDSIDVRTVVLAVNPENPLDGSFVSAIDRDWDLIRYFESVSSIKAAAALSGVEDGATLAALRQHEGDH